MTSFTFETPGGEYWKVGDKAWAVRIENVGPFRRNKVSLVISRIIS